MKRPIVDVVNKESPAPSRDVLEWVHEIMHLFRARQYRALRHEARGISHMEGKILGFFARHSGATLSELVAHSGRDKGQLAKLIKTLRGQGLLAPQTGAQSDRRSIRLALTPAGLATHRLLRQRSAQLARTAIRGLSPADEGKLLALLKKVRDNLDESR